MLGDYGSFRTDPISPFGSSGGSGPPGSLGSFGRSRITPKKDRIQIAILITLILNLLMLIVLYITIIDTLELIAHSPTLKKLAKVNLDNLIESLQLLDLKSLIQVFQRIEIGKIESFIDSIIDLADQVNTNDIIKFVEGIDNCIINECYRK